MTMTRRRIKLAILISAIPTVAARITTRLAIHSQCSGKNPIFISITNKLTININDTSTLNHNIITMNHLPKCTPINNITNNNSMLMISSRKITLRWNTPVMITTAKFIHSLRVKTKKERKLHRWNIMCPIWLQKKETKVGFQWGRLVL